MIDVVRLVLVATSISAQSAFDNGILMNQSASNKLLHTSEVAPIAYLICDPESSFEATAIPSFE